MSTTFLGYTKNENGERVIATEEAKVIRRIFREFLDGKSPYKIANGLERDGVLTGSGGSRWYDSTVVKILRNEKYMGDALLQKTFTVDFLTKKRVKNNGHAAQYYVEDSHPAIIGKEEFAAVQLEFERRSNMRGYSKTGKSKFTSDYAFSGKLFCGNCGSKFRRTKWGKGKNQQVVWICINHQMGGDCDLKAVKEKALEQAFVWVMNRFIDGEKSLVNVDRRAGVSEDRVREIDARLEQLQQGLMEIVRRAGVDDEEYATLAAEIELLRDRRQKLKDAEAERVWRDGQMEEFKAYLAARDGRLLDRFDEELFRRLVDKVRVQSMVEVEFMFKAGVEVREILG